MWIFGYGSLVWKADFPYIKKVVGYIKGYERKFYQASIDHRGVPEKPGRVVTLIPSVDPNNRVWGVVYKIHRRDVDYVIKHLDMREVMGYEKVPVEFYPIPHHPLNIFDHQPQRRVHSTQNCNTGDESLEFDNSFDEREVDSEEVDSGRGSITSEEDSRNNGDSSSDTDSDNMPSSDDDDDFDTMYARVREGRPFIVTMYFGAQNNEHYIGSASLSQMALEIYESSGSSGPNRDYLFNLAQSMREICSEALDNHLHELENAVRSIEIGMSLQMNEMRL